MWSKEMKRRDLLVYGGRAVLSGLAARAITQDVVLAQRESQVSPGALEQRIAGVIEAYDAQGNHRTGTEVDNTSAEWLASQVRHSGAAASLEPFALNRIDPQPCYLRIADRRIDSVPVFDAGFTGAEGVHGKLGPLGSDAEIGLVESEPARLTEPGIEEPDQVREARRSQHKAVVVLTRGVRPALYLLNASDFRKPFGPPMLQISSSESEWLRELAAVRAEATLVAQIVRTAARAFNVTAKIAGSNPALAPLVLMVPRSAWWQCASEQGSRLACWLEAIRVLAAGTPARDCFFVALTGHELGYLGMDVYIKRRPELIKRAHAWIFFGSDIGAPRQPNLIHASDNALEQWTVTAMEKEGLTVNAKARQDSIARGETGTVQRGGGRFVTLACASEVYHSTADRWPEAVDVSLLARYARAFANGALQLAGHSG
jgi:peptidase M28-like protein